MQNTTSKNLISFIKNSPSPFHAILAIKKVLNREGFIELSETNPFNLVKGGKYYVCKNGSSIIAFKIGEELDNYSFSMVASHSDSPTFKIKPNCDFVDEHYHRLNVEGYGGMIGYSWFDRPLSIAGRVIYQNEKEINSSLLNFDKNVAIIPSLPIHFNRECNNDFKINFACDMYPFIGENKSSFKEIIANELKMDKDNILSYDLFLYSRQEGTFVGLDDEYISSAKLDDLQCAYTTLLGFIKSNNPHNVSLYACFDNEEVGSQTLQGAKSRFLDTTLERISLSLNKSKEEHLAALANSFMVSSDNAHAVNPNHGEITDKLNDVYMNKGIVIKSNAAQSYSSDAISSSIFMQICKNADVPYQLFTNKSGTRGGGTLGNISITQVSINTVDIGLPQLAMHSINEVAGTLDNEYMVKAIKEFYDSNICFSNNKIVIDK